MDAFKVFKDGISSMLSYSTRLLVLEQAVLLEEMLSSTLGIILGIDEKKSKSLGFGSTALSFNQKVLLIQDKKGIDKEIKLKLEVFMHLRNKFAHVKSVDTFENYFILSIDCQKDKNRLINWYSKSNSSFDESERQYHLLYIDLTHDIFKYLMDITIKCCVDEGAKKRKHELDEKFIEVLKQKSLQSPISIEIWNETIEEVLNELNRK